MGLYHEDKCDTGKSEYWVTLSFAETKVSNFSLRHTRP